MSEPEEENAVQAPVPRPPADPPIVDLPALALVIGLMALAVLMMLAMVNR